MKTIYLKCDICEASFKVLDAIDYDVLLHHLLDHFFTEVNEEDL